MPYIIPELRNNVGSESGPISPGELNYLITASCHEYIIRNGLCYATINEAIGVLECAKLELYRQVAAKYENKKKSENGPVSELDKNGE